MTRDEAMTDRTMTGIATRAAQRIASAESLDTVSAKEVYRTVIEAIAEAVGTTGGRQDERG